MKKILLRTSFVIVLFLVMLSFPVYGKDAGPGAPVNTAESVDSDIKADGPQSVFEKKRAECKFCKEKKDKYWKIYSEPVPHLIEDKKWGTEFLVIPFVIILYIITGILIYKKKVGKQIRRTVQAFAFIILGIVFVQCLCTVKYLTVGTTTLIGGNYLLALGEAWIAVLTVIFTIILMKKFRRFYCYWICPLGFTQDIIKDMKIDTLIQSRTAKLVILIILGIFIPVAVYIVPVQPWVMGSGLLLIMLMIISSILTILYPDKKRILKRFKYGTFIFWIVVNIGQRVFGPWCSLAVANITYHVFIGFICVLIVSLVNYRGWCEYACPDGGLFKLISGKKK